MEGGRFGVIAVACACACANDPPPAYGHWAPMAATPTTADVGIDAAAWNGEQLAVWSSYLRQVQLYTRATNTWAPAPAGPSSLGEGPAFVWGDSHLYVWAPSDCDEACGGGWVFDPGKLAWSRMSRAGEPATEDTHGLLSTWTGTAMLVWDPTAVVGGVYNPATDSWRPMSTTNAPSARQVPSSVWTGTELLVWGGAAAPNDGARYDPATDRWTPISTSGAPRSRVWADAAWTGTEMLIWGGTACGGVNDPCNEGAAYNPSLDHWRVVPNDNGPGEAMQGAAVWDGHEVIVWGGFPDGHAGARWDPVTNTWTRMSSVGAPPGRRGSFAVWTGTDMLVAFGDDTESGGFYTP